jgi:hypothetical protein
MATEVEDVCRGCGESVVLIASSGGDLRCPTCGCVFRHNAKKWFLALPMAVAVSAAAIYFGSEIVSPLICALVSVGLVLSVILCMPNHVVVIPPYQKTA